MKKNFFAIFILPILMTLASCGQYLAVQKSEDFEYRYEEAKACFVEGSYMRSSSLLSDLLIIMKNTANGEECLYMLAQSEFGLHDYETAANYFKKYYQTYPKGIFAEQARFYSALSLYNEVPDVRLDQTSTWDAIKEFQTFLDYHPQSRLKDRAQKYVADLQDLLVEKELITARLYYDLGDYMNNCAFGGSNYDACIVTAENALKDFPYASPTRREELSILILRSKYQLARQSVEEKRIERFRSAIDEYYSFVNDYPESKYVSEAKNILANAESIVKRKHIKIDDEEE